MALNPKTATLKRNAALNAIFDLLNSGKLICADGIQPVDCDTAIGSQVDAADLAFGSTAFAAASAASKAANSITSDTDANASTTITWVTLIEAANAFSGARTMDMSAGTAGANVNFNAVVVGIHATVACTSLSITQAA